MTATAWSCQTATRLCWTLFSWSHFHLSKTCFTASTVLLTRGIRVYSEETWHDCWYNSFAIKELMDENVQLWRQPFKTEEAYSQQTKPLIDLHHQWVTGQRWSVGPLWNVRCIQSYRFSNNTVLLAQFSMPKILPSAVRNLNKLDFMWYIRFVTVDYD